MGIANVSIVQIVNNHWLARDLLQEMITHIVQIALVNSLPKKCYSCIKPITGIGGTKYISFENRHWHNECFTCQGCSNSLVGRGFLTDNEAILCPDCGRN